MYCEVCARLKADYEHSVRLYKQASARIHGALGDDVVTARQIASDIHTVAIKAHRDLVDYLKVAHWKTPV